MDLKETEEIVKQRGAEFAQLVIAAYELADKGATENEAFRSYVGITDHSTDAECYKLETGEEQIFVFPGTESVTDWKMNVQSVPVRKRGLWVHRGFHRGIAKMLKSIESHMDGVSDVWFLGHSLGGAYAEQCALLLSGETLGKVGSFTFGKPNVFARWQHFKDNMRRPAKMISLVNAYDLVPLVPRFFFKPCDWQTKILLYKNRTGGMVTKDRLRKFHRYAMTLTNHGMEEYLARVASITYLDEAPR